MAGQLSPGLPDYSRQEARPQPDAERNGHLSRIAQGNRTPLCPGLSSRPGETPVMEMSSHLQLEEEESSFLEDSQIRK